MSTATLQRPPPSARPAERSAPAAAPRIATAMLHLSCQRPAATPRFGSGDGLDALPNVLSIRIVDDVGRCLLLIDDPQDEFDLQLPAGNYRLTARDGEVETEHRLSLVAAGRHRLVLRLAQRRCR